jgi:hypothetical protein
MVVDSPDEPTVVEEIDEYKFNHNILEEGSDTSSGGCRDSCQLASVRFRYGGGISRHFFG